jgi:oligopeptide/dipeptide ABC transporter ATP-binding protein
LQVENLVKHFPVRGGGLLGRSAAVVRAVDGVSFHVRPGETFGLVGESGCGKTTTGRVILRLIEPTSGCLSFEGADILSLKQSALQAFRRRMQVIFQDAYSSFDPRRKVGDIVDEPLRVHGLGTAGERAERVKDLLHLVGLGPELAGEYPHSLSSGQRQSVGIARALALNPRFLVCDEPVSSLDVLVRAQVLNLLKRLQREMGLTYLFIAHDMSVVRFISDHIGVMYLGLIVETATKAELFREPLHPYSVALLSAVPVPDPNRAVNRQLLEGDVPSPINPPSGCRFHTRCSRAMPFCSKNEPLLREVAPGHQVACHLV